ncbi:MAG: hypothetical protein ACK56F_04730, partial [bacterium]
ASRPTTAGVRPRCCCCWQGQVCGAGVTPSLTSAQAPGLAMGLPPDQSERPLNLELEIATAEGDGTILRRRITVKRFRLSPCGTAVTLGAHCHHRGV